MVVFFKQKKRKRAGERGEKDPVAIFVCFRERISSFSLDLQAIRPSEFFGARSKAALREEAYAWAPVLGIFVKLREVGDLSYLSYTLYLSVFVMFELIEAVSGRLIGPKSWNRIIRKF